ncbi:pyridoxal phosphate-dependent aminotransferase [Clostridium thermarum]|uniref:pyridoxal phosphate-dependent aminotransferase n=1 Tax=Clostridium thermarum TaxID=1716543 RepID=UPI0019400FE3|nr:aminotransferase class I/II-fold pyridoxal phosphate-dependent enzyme [Clostridium thermarum]
MNVNVESIAISGIRRFFNKVAEVPGALSLTIGEPDFPVPQEIKNAMIEAINNDKTRYTSNMGLDELRKELSNYLAKKDIHYSMEEICITVGGSEGLFSVFNALINPGDGVIIPSISYPAYESIVKVLGGRVLNCEVNGDFTLNIESIRRIIKEHNPKVLVLSYPSNPTGAVLSNSDMEALYEMAKNSDLIIISDEMYSALIFDEYYSLAQVKELKDKIILVGGFSKMFSMTGLRIGYVCAVDVYMKQILKVHQYNVSCAPSIAQFGALEGLRKSLYHLDSVNKELKKRADYVYRRLQGMGFEVAEPMGAFYIFPSIKKLNLCSEEFCERLLNEAKVAVVPGNAFGRAGEGYIRISYCYGMEVLKQGMDRIEEWLSKIKICEN